LLKRTDALGKGLLTSYTLFDAYWIFAAHAR